MCLLPECLETEIHFLFYLMLWFLSIDHPTLREAAFRGQWLMFSLELDSFSQAWTVLASLPLSGMFIYRLMWRLVCTVRTKFSFSSLSIFWSIATEIAFAYWLLPLSFEKNFFLLIYNFILKEYPRIPSSLLKCFTFLSCRVLKFSVQTCSDVLWLPSGQD